MGALRDGERTVGGLAEAVEMEPSAVSQQLRVLRLLGLAVGERRGRHVHDALHDPHVATLRGEAAAHVVHRRLGLPDPVGSAARAGAA
ncbi:MAG TPA: metalloregulator ArsR/SmtB family transcription factor [Miltoncostaeaceae bacterium]|nr:metalloregulator ArsR/SmtB family transcription factor [Miltoncostaeaceae bacterium]